MRNNYLQMHVLLQISLFKTDKMRTTLTVYLVLTVVCIGSFSQTAKTRAAQKTYRIGPFETLKFTHPSKVSYACTLEIYFYNIRNVHTELHGTELSKSK